LGNVYDTKFSWLDKEMYSTELVWKIYKRAAQIELCEAKLFEKIEINDTIVKRKIKIQMGDSIAAFTKIVSPTDLYNSSYLFKIK
ncbi:MAG: YiiX/YebB-like N1pC/P60 family cysteine hydrolase, partial [Bacteroidota bacterium]